MLNKQRLILVVEHRTDDRAVLYAALAQALDGLGCMLATCGSGAEALRYVADHRPELLFCDARLWDMDILELIEDVRRISPQTHVFLIGEPGDWPLYTEALQSGGEDLLLKPLQREELRRSVQRAFGNDASR